MTKIYIPLSEAVQSKTLSSPLIYHFTDEHGERHGGLHPAKVQAAAGNRRIDVSFADIFNGHLLGPDYNTDKKIKEDFEQPLTYKKLLEGLDKRNIENQPLVHHFATRGEDNGESHFTQKGSLNREKIENMADGREIKSTPLNQYQGHLMGKEYIGTGVEKHQDSYNYPKVGTTVREDLNEARKDAASPYHDTYRSALEAGYKHAADKGFDVHEEDQYGFHVDPRPHKDETKRLHFRLLKDGKEHKKQLHVQVYNRGLDAPHSNYEVNHYIA